MVTYVFRIFYVKWSLSLASVFLENTLQVAESRSTLGTLITVIIQAFVALGAKDLLAALIQKAAASNREAIQVLGTPLVALMRLRAHVIRATARCAFEAIVTIVCLVFEAGEAKRCFRAKAFLPFPAPSCDTNRFEIAPCGAAV